MRRRLGVKFACIRERRHRRLQASFYQQLQSGGSAKEPLHSGSQSFQSLEQSATPAWLEGTVDWVRSRERLRLFAGVGFQIAVSVATVIMGRR